jgi:hypothetical protein
MGQERNFKKGANFNTTYVIFFTKYEKDLFDNGIDKFASMKAKKVPL